MLPAIKVPSYQVGSRCGGICGVQLSRSPPFSPDRSKVASVSVYHGPLRSVRVACFLAGQTMLYYGSGEKDDGAAIRAGYI